MNKEGNFENMRERWWEEGERHDVEFNEKVLKLIFEIVNPNSQNLVSTCSTAKDAWDLLQNVWKGKSIAPPSTEAIILTPTNINSDEFPRRLKGMQ